MITLKTNTKLVAYTEEAIVTNNISFDTAFYSNKVNAPDITENSLFGDITGTTSVDITEIPPVLFHNNVTNINIFNNDTVPHVINIAKDLLGATTILFKIVLNPNENWIYPIASIKEKVLQNKMAQIGRTLTNQTEILTLSDIGTQLISNYTGVGYQTITIPEGVFDVGNSLEVIRLGNPFGILVDNQITQAINIEKFSKHKFAKLSLLYLNLDTKENWIVSGGSSQGIMYASPDVEYSTLTGVEEDDDYIYYTYYLMSVTTNSSLYTHTVKIYDKNTGTTRHFFAPIVYQSIPAGIYRLKHASVYIYMLGWYNGNGVARRLSFLNGTPIDSLLSYTQSSVTVIAPQKCVEYRVNGQYRFIVRHNTNSTTANFFETYYSNGIFYNTDRLLPLQWGFYSGCWDGINSTGAGTSYILLSKSTGGINKIDTHNLTSVATLARDQCLFINTVIINGYAWYLRANYIGRVAFADLSNTEWILPFSAGSNITFKLESFNEVDNIIYVVEHNGYRYVKFYINDPNNFEIFDLTTDLDTYIIRGVSYLHSTRQLYIHAYRTSSVEIPTMIYAKTLIYQQ
jgi:hypothetical protein